MVGTLYYSHLSPRAECVVVKSIEGVLQHGSF